MKKRLISMMLAVATVVSLTACSGVEANTSRTSSVESSSITESTESTTSTATDSKADTTATSKIHSDVETNTSRTSSVESSSITESTESTTATTTDSKADTTATSTVHSDVETSTSQTSSVEPSSITESTDSTTATTNDSKDNTTTKSTSSTYPKEEKSDERNVYDEDGNVVDKIKVKVVDGVTYTVGGKSDDKCILDGIPLYTNDPEFPSGDILTIVQTVIYMKGEKVTQKEIFEKYVDYLTPDEWYEEDGIKYGPKLCKEKLVQDPRLEPTNYFNGGLGNVAYYCKRFFEDKSIKVIDYSSNVRDIMELYDRLKVLVDQGHLPVVTVNNNTKNIWIWVTNEMRTQEILDGEYVYSAIGYSGDKFIVYDVKYNKILSMDCTIIEVYSI